MTWSSRSGSVRTPQPRRQAAVRPPATDDSPVTVTYDLSRLQRLPEQPDGTRYLVTLGGQDIVDPGRVIDTMEYEHPLYTLESIDAQPALRALSGARNTYFAGAHHGNGFHEDGLASGVRVAAALGVEW